MSHAATAAASAPAPAASSTTGAMVLTDATFDAVIAGATLLVFVDCYADWCGPCRMMAPHFDAFAREQGARAVVATLDTEANPQTAARLGIRGIPTLVVFRGGEELGRQSGALMKPHLEAILAAVDGASASPTG